MSQSHAAAPCGTMHLVCTGLTTKGFQKKLHPYPQMTMSFCMRVCACVPAYVFVREGEGTKTWEFVCVHLHIVRVYVRVCVCVSVCTCMFVHVCMSVLQTNVRVQVELFMCAEIRTACHSPVLRFLTPEYPFSWSESTQQEYRPNA
jgi:hypothetical protein